MTTPGPPDDPTRLLFACDACAGDNCAECVHLTVGAWCPHGCHWLWAPPTPTPRENP